MLAPSTCVEAGGVPSAINNLNVDAWPCKVYGGISMSKWAVQSCSYADNEYVTDMLSH